MLIFRFTVKLFSIQGENNLNCVILYYGIGSAYLDEGGFEKAFEYLNKSLMVSIKNHLTYCGGKFTKRQI